MEVTTPGAHFILEWNHPIRTQQRAAEFVVENVCFGFCVCAIDQAAVGVTGWPCGLPHCAKCANANCKKICPAPACRKINVLRVQKCKFCQEAFLPTPSTKAPAPVQEQLSAIMTSLSSLGEQADHLFIVHAIPIPKLAEPDSIDNPKDKRLVGTIFGTRNLKVTALHIYNFKL